MHMTTTKLNPAKTRDVVAAQWTMGMMMCTLMLCVFIAMPRMADAQSSTLPLTTTPLLMVSPMVAAVAEPRTLTVTGQWPNTCAPVAATLDSSLFTVAKTITIRLQAPLTLVACAQVLTPYRFDLAYAGREVGVARVLIVSSTGAPTGEGRVVTTAPGLTRSAGNISGAWYDRVTSGSGLSFIHAYQGSDAVFGTWYLYDRDGLPRWLSIQDVTWSEGGTVMEGKLFETRAGADICPQNVTACPATSTSLAKIGRMRATFAGIDLYNDVSPQAKIEAFSNTNTLLFSSNIIRAF
jgi:hypothetical protein